ncbi:disease resistance protein TAO1 isoform X2 [Cryptomeria japonica]|uniref:disease resistance protein TAO1 isoform X2 n=1 Tax=Cryptomeria japonica TaxID=3369 RepID=UPI0027DA831B|nr:disease resistance protein TAO1 isoform X2 [Cryptomeria japonica]
MAKIFCSLCCCSCCSLPSPSPPQSLQQQQPTISISSPPHQQSITNTGHSTTSSPSQHSQQELTPTMKGFKDFLHKFNDISQIEGLIPVLEELYKIASGEKSDDGGSNSGDARYTRGVLDDGQRILKMLDTRIGKRPGTTNSMDSVITEIGKVCTEVLKGSEKIPKVGMALCILGSVLERFSKMSDNKSECLEVLRRMLNLGRQILQLNEQIPEQKLNEGIECIVVGTVMCISQLARANIFRFVTATVNADSLKAFQLKIDRLYSDIQLSTTIAIGDRVPMIGSQSQKIYAYQPRVGIDSGLKSVIQRLDLDAQDAIPIVVVVYGFGGIGKTTLADAVYADLNLQSYKHCRIHMHQDCTYNDLKDIQQQILKGLFNKNLQLKNCDEGQARLRSLFKENPNQPLFLYIDNGLKSTDLEQLVPQGLGTCLPPKSRILIITRNLHETDIFAGRNIQLRQYDVNPLPDVEARKLLLEKVSDYNDENNIDNLLKLCGGVPLLLELAGSQLAINRGNTKNIVLEMLKEGEKVKEKDISDRMVGFVYDRLLEPVQEAFLDITSFFYKYWTSENVASIVGEEEFRALEAASFVKTDEYGNVIVHDIVRARGKKLSEQEGNRITDRESLLECLKNEERLKKLKGIGFDEEDEQPPIEINCHHLNCMSNSLKVLCYSGSQITFKEKCHKPFQQLRCLIIYGDVPDLPMEFEKLEHLTYYRGPLTQGMSLYEFPPSLRNAYIQDYSGEDRVAYSKIPPKVTPDSSLVTLSLSGFKNMQRLPDGVEKLTELEELFLFNWHQLKELPSKLRDLSDLKRLTLYQCNELKELRILSCSALSALPSNFGQLKNLEQLQLKGCSGLKELPSDFGQLKNLKKLNLWGCFGLEKWPLNFGDLTEMQEINLAACN